MKKLLLVACIFALATSVNAQKTSMKSGGTTFSIAGNVGSGTFSGGKLAAGGDLQADLPAATGLKITISAGYESFGFQYGIAKGHSSYIPLLGGVKFNLASNLYGHAQLGYSISTISNGKGAFTYAPSVGYMFSPNFDASVKYLGLSYGNGSNTTISAIVARLAYNF